MPNDTIPLPEPYGRVTMHTVSGLEFFYRHPDPPYLDTAKSCTVVYTTDALHAHAAAVTAARDAEIAALRARLALHDSCNGRMTGEPPRYTPECAVLRAEVAGLRADAERWRHIRDKCAWTATSANGLTRIAIRLPVDMPIEADDELDAAVDVARKGTP